MVCWAALSAWRTRSCAILAGALAVLGVAACGGQTHRAHHSKGRFRVAVETATFPARQHVSRHAHLVIAVRNAGSRAIPNVAVTICNVTCAYPAPRGEGTSAAAFGADLSQPRLSNPSRPVWIVDAAPGPCGYSCRHGGRGAAVTAYSNTWALGRLAPGRTARFDWSVTPVQAGRHVVAWEVAAGLNGRARTALAAGGRPHGTFTVDVSGQPPQSYVDNDGRIVTTQ